MLNTYIEKELGIRLTAKQLEQFDAYYHLIVEYNQHTNLTRITDRHEADIKHFLDSMLLVRLIDTSKKLSLCDMGAGAGFPSIPLLILNNHIEVTIVESQTKRVQFLNLLKSTLGLPFEIVHARAEDYAREHQKQFDYVTARALGELRMILEFGSPMLKVGGYFIAPKGSKYEEELQDAKQAILTLGMMYEKSDLVRLPEGHGFRANMLFKKVAHKPGYPRAFSLIKKKPL